MSKITINKKEFDTDDFTKEQRSLLKEINLLTGLADELQTKMNKIGVYKGSLERTKNQFVVELEELLKPTKPKAKGTK